MKGKHAVFIAAIVTIPRRRAGITEESARESATQVGTRKKGFNALPFRRFWQLWQIWQSPGMFLQQMNSYHIQAHAHHDLRSPDASHSSGRYTLGEQRLLQTSHCR